MTAPRPVAGPNPYTLMYQVAQYDTTIPPKETPLDALNQPPQAGVDASSSPDKLFAENTDPPVGAGGNETGGIF